MVKKSALAVINIDRQRAVARRRGPGVSCPSCGIQIYRTSLLGSMTPLNISGIVVDGICLACNPNTQGFLDAVYRRKVPQVLTLPNMSDDTNCADTFVSHITLDAKELEQESLGDGDLMKRSRRLHKDNGDELDQGYHSRQRSQSPRRQLVAKIPTPPVDETVKSPSPSRVRQCENLPREIVLTPPDMVYSKGSNEVGDCQEACHLSDRPSLEGLCRKAQIMLGSEKAPKLPLEQKVAFMTELLDKALAVERGRP